VSPAGSCYSF